MARAVISSIDGLTDIISQAKSELEKKREVQSILQELLAMRRFLEDGEGARAETEVEVGEEKRLLKSLNERIIVAEEAIVNYVLKTVSHKRSKTLVKKLACWDNSGAANKKILEKITSISKSIKDLNDEFKKSSNNYSGGNKSFKMSDWISSCVDFDESKDEYLSTVVGLRPDMEPLKEWLFGSARNCRIISVLGIQGIGKTRLVWEIYKNSSVVEHFKCKAWVCASAIDNDSKNICEEIQKQINGFEPDKRYLIVIDDVRDPLDWSKLRNMINDGSRFILTTRDLGIACSTDYSHRLKVLSKTESWELFSKKLLLSSWQLGGINASGKDTTDHQYPFPVRDLPPELQTLGRKMVEKCGGIPYLIVELAKLLSTMNANIVEWSCVLHGTDTHLSQEQHPWFNLSSSVDDILPFHVKQFLHLFPTATPIPERRLTLSWAAEGELSHQQQQQQQKSDSSISGQEAASALCWMQDLLDLNLIQAVKVSSIGIAKAYSIPRDHPLLQILKAGGALGSSDGDNDKVWIHRIADHCGKQDIHSRCIHDSGMSPEELRHYKTLCSFWCFNYPGGYKPGQELGSFLKKCINTHQLWFLRVLDLEGVYKPNLPKAIGELINLQYLGLRWTYLDTLPSSVENLINLLTLDTKHTDIGDYPTIEKMTKLQHLYLNERHRSELVTQLSFLGDLQTLSGVIVDDSSQVKDGLDKLKKLRKLRLTCRGLKQKEEMAKWIGELGSLQTLKLTSKNNEPVTLRSTLQNLGNNKLTRLYLRGVLGGSLKNHHEYFESNLVALTFSLTALVEDPMPILERLPNLKLVCLLCNSYDGPLMHCKSKMFKELRVLKIWKLENLKGWTIEDGAMEKLEELEIRSCKNLEMLPDHLPKALQELKLTDMTEEFSSKVTAGKDCQKVAYVSSVIMEDPLPSFSTSVKLYTGQNSDFFGQQDPKRQLEKLIDSERFKVINLTKLTLSETKLKQDPMPVLEKLLELTVLILSSKSFTGKQMVCSQGGFKKLQNLVIQELEELEKLMVEDGAMPELVELEIRSCKNLKELPEVVKKLKLAKMPREFTEKFKSDKRIIIEN